jgi:hypothetical protein
MRYASGKVEAGTWEEDALKEPAPEPPAAGKPDAQ